MEQEPKIVGPENPKQEIEKAIEIMEGLKAELGAIVSVDTIRLENRVRELDQQLKIVLEKIGK